MNTEVITGSTTELSWFKSSYSGAEGGDCIEIAADPRIIYVRDSKDRGKPHLTLSPQVWSAFVKFVA